MAVYTPAFETQRDESAPTPWTNCNPASVAMLIDWYTYGRVNTSDVAIRRSSPVPLGSGMNFAQIDAAIRKMGLSTGGLLYSDLPSGNANITWADLVKHLKGGGGAVVCGNYGDANFRNSNGWGTHKSTAGLRIDRWQPYGTFGHAVYVGQGDDDTVLLMDPLGHGDYKGDRISWAALWDFIWKTGWQDANVRVVAAHWFTAARPAAPVIPAPKPNPVPTCEQRLAQKNAYCDAAGRAVRTLERSMSATDQSRYAGGIEGVRRVLRALRGA